MTAHPHPFLQGSLPPDWVISTVDEIKAPERHSCVAGPFGSSVSAKFFVEEGVPLIRGSNLSLGLDRFVADHFAFVSAETAAKFAAQTVIPGDLVFTCWGTIGQVGLIPPDGPFDRYIISNKQLKLRVDPAVIEPLFAYYYFASPQTVTYIKDRAIGAAVPGINLGILKALPVLLPPLETQRRIASILGAYDDLIEVNRRRVAILEEMARGLFEEWFVRFRFPGHQSVPLVETPDGQLPEGWVCQPFSEIVEVLSGGTPKKDVPAYWGGDIPFFTPRDAPSSAWATTTISSVTPEGVAKCNSKLYPAETVFITARGTVGKVALAAQPMAMNQSCYALIGTGYPQFFVFSFTQFAAAQLKAMSNGAVFDTIIVDTFRKLRLNTPPAALAKKYHNQVAPIFEQSKTLGLSIDRLCASRDLLLPRLISGQLSVEAAECELEGAA